MRLSKVFERFVSEYCFDRGLSGSTIDNYRFAVNILLQEVGDIPIRAITIEDVRNCRLRMENQNRERNGVVSYMYKLRLFFRWAGKYHKVGLNPEDITVPKRQKKIPDYLTREEINLLMVYADPRERAIIALLFSSAMRVSELVQVRIKDISRDFVKIRGKGSVDREIFINSSARHYINTYLSTRTDNIPFLFYSHKRRGLTIHGVQLLLNRLGKRANIGKPVSPKVFRHSSATDLLMNGLDIRYIQEHLGHADISTTMIYTHVAKADLQGKLRLHQKELTIIA